MNDNIKEVGKSIGRTKRDAEAALRRYAPKHPKIERTRDIFDEVVSFEMEFNTEPNDTLMSLDLLFNKPPPMKDCKPGEFIMNCNDFITTVGGGAHLLQVEPYWPGTVSVFVNGLDVGSGGFSEYDAANGLVFVAGVSDPQTIVICYVKIQWTYACDDTADPLLGTQNNSAFLATDFPPDRFITSVFSDSDDSTTSIPRYNYTSSIIGDYEVYTQGDRRGTLTWTAHVGDHSVLAGSQTGETETRVEGFIIIHPTLDDPLNPTANPVDWNNFRCSMYLHNVIPLISDTLTNGTYARARIQIGPVFIETRNYYQYFNIFGPPTTLAFVQVNNNGNADKDNNLYAAFTNHGPTFTINNNELLFISVVVNQVADTIQVYVNDNYTEFPRDATQTHEFGNNYPSPSYLYRSPSGYFSMNGGPVPTPLNVQWDAECFNMITSKFFLDMTVTELTPCGYTDLR